MTTVKNSEPDKGFVDSLAALQAAYGRWRRLIGKPPEANGDATSFCDALNASLQIGQRSISSREEADRLHASLSRGKELVSTALQWDGPVVGDMQSPTSRLRGLQWRLVIAWCGLEQILKQIGSNARNTGHNTSPEEIERIASILDLPAYRPLGPPNAQLTRLRRYREDAGSDGVDAINGFLQSESRSMKRTLSSWLVNGEPVRTWPAAFGLVKALRNATVHGSLSGSKIEQWGLSGGLERMVRDVGTFTAAIFKEMVRRTSRLDGNKPCQVLPLLNRALSKPAPEAEAILSGTLTSEIRNRRTQSLGRIYIYSSHRRRTADEEIAVLNLHGLAHLHPERLVRGMILGTVELHECEPVPTGFRWHFQDPERWKRGKLPDGKPQGAWFTPFADSKL